MRPPGVRALAGWRAHVARRPATAAPRWPAVGPVVPVGVLPLVAGLLAGALVLAAFPGTWLLAAAVGVLVAVLPRAEVVVGLVLVLAAHLVLQPPVPVQPRYFALLAGVHLLHVLTALARALPRRGWVQLAALARPLGRFAAVQAGAQVVALAVLLPPRGPGGGLGGLVVPALGVLGAVALLAVVAALVRPLLRRPPR